MSDSSIPQKQCSRCRNFYPLGSFAHSSTGKYGCATYCRKCSAERKGRKYRPHCLMPDGMKQCTVCKEMKLLDEFKKHKPNKSGLSHKCKACGKAQDAKYLSEHREENKATSKARYYAKPEARAKYRIDNAEKIAAGKRDWRKRNPDKVKAHKKDSAKRHPESQARRLKRYNERHPEVQSMRVHVQNMRQRAKQMDDLFDWKRSELAAMYAEQEGKCAYCGISIYWSVPHDVHVDHIHPLSRGGTNELSNLCLSCQDCNFSKGNKTIPEWQAVRGW